MMKYIKKVLILLIVFLSYGCSLKTYYFPLTELEEGKVYKYECKEDSSKTEYWKLTYDSKKQILTTEAFKADLVQYELFKEKITNKGTEVIEFVTYFNNDTNESFSTNNLIKDSDVFKWKSKEPYKYSSETSYDKNIKVKFSKERQYIGKTKINLFGKEFNAIEFKGNYKTIILNSDKEYKYSQKSYYASGIGLVRMEKTYDYGESIILELTEIMSLNQWKNMRKTF